MEKDDIITRSKAKAVERKLFEEDSPTAGCSKSKKSRDDISKSELKDTGDSSSKHSSDENNDEEIDAGNEVGSDDEELE